MQEKTSIIYLGRTEYRSNSEGKAAFVREKLLPVLLSIDAGWIDAEYVEEGPNEYVVVTNKNSDKTKKINVSCDSVRALFDDVVRQIVAIY